MREQRKYEHHIIADPVKDPRLVPSTFLQGVVLAALALPALLMPLFDAMGGMLSSCFMGTLTFSIFAQMQDEPEHCSGMKAEQLLTSTNHHSHSSMLENKVWAGAVVQII